MNTRLVIIMIIPFSERKDYTAFKYGGKCLKFVCPVKPIRNQLFYLKAFRGFDRTLLQVIGGGESESVIRFQLLTSTSFLD